MVVVIVYIGVYVKVEFVDVEFEGFILVVDV